MGIEPMTSSLPRKCSTTELHKQICNVAKTKQHRNMSPCHQGRIYSGAGSCTFCGRQFPKTTGKFQQLPSGSVHGNKTGILKTAFRKASRTLDGASAVSKAFFAFQKQTAARGETGMITPLFCAFWGGRCHLPSRRGPPPA